jgi:hypothetical protein
MRMIKDNCCAVDLEEDDEEEQVTKVFVSARLVVKS